MTQTISSFPAPQRFRTIQYLRALAALSVVTYHASVRVSENLPEAANAALYLGHGGVDLFFVISGFIMWTIGHAAPQNPGVFLLRRAIRVIPPYWIASLCWLGLMLAMGVQWYVVDLPHVVYSLLFIPHWSPTFPEKFWPMLVPGWTLLFEMFFYAVFAITLLAPPKRRLAVLTGSLAALVVLGLVAPTGSAVLQAYTSPLLLEFLAGVLIAELWRRGLCSARFGAGAILLGLLVLVILSPLAVPDQTSWGRPLTFGLAGALIVWGALSLESRLPDWPLLERLGDGSYAIYLFHLFVVTALSQIWSRMPGGDTGVAAWAFILLCLGAATALGLWLFTHLERPLQNRLSAGLRAKGHSLRSES